MNKNGHAEERSSYPLPGIRRKVAVPLDHDPRMSHRSRSARGPSRPSPAVRTAWGLSCPDRVVITGILPEMGRVAAATIHSFPSVVPDLGSGSAEAFLASSTLQYA